MDYALDKVRKLARENARLLEALESIAETACICWDRADAWVRANDTRHTLTMRDWFRNIDQQARAALE